MNSKAILIALIPFIAGLYSVDAGIEKIEESSFEVSPNDLFEVDVKDADVTINGIDGAKTIDIKITRYAKNDDPEIAEAAFERIQYQCEQIGDVVSLKSVRQSGQRNWFDGDRFQVKTQIEVVLPKASRVTSKATDGDIELSSIRGTVSLKSHDGDITLKGLNGDAGIQSYDGDVYIKDVEGDVQVKSNDGGVEIVDLRGFLDAKTYDGDLDIRDLNGSLKCSSHDGNVKIHFSQAPSKDCEIKTYDGDLRLNIPARVELNYRLSVYDGKIDFPAEAWNMEGHQSNDRERLSISHFPGKPVITANSQDGSIIIRELQ